MISAGLVKVDSRWLKASAQIPRGALITVYASARHDRDETTRATAPRVLFRAGDYLVLDKPRGLHTHKGRSGSSAAAYLERCDASLINVGHRPEECGIAHRLDRDTSGVLLAATTRERFVWMRRCFQLGHTRKWYLALVQGCSPESFVVDTALSRRRTRVVAARRGLRAWPAETRVVKIDAGDGWSLLRAEMSSGVTHQIRAHLALAGHALLGDLKYGGPPAPASAGSGQLLHAARIVLHMDGETLDFSCPPGLEFVRAYAQLLAQRKQ